MPRELTGRDLDVEVDPDLLDLVPEFLAARRAELADLEQASGAGPSQVVRHVGHRLRGVAPMYGFDWLGALGEELEAHGVCDPADIADEVSLLRDYLHRVRYRAA
ncbi:MAG: Hpt domain-containing protein [Myxococcales bacterium]|nr:Hpt domain-containing protein [Myxococcales bacterium]